MIDSPLSKLELTNEHRLIAVRFIARRIKSWEEAEDVVQEAVLKLVENPPHEAVENPGAYLIKVSLNIAIDRHRSSQARKHREHQWAELRQRPTSHAENPEAAFLARADLQESIEALEELGPTVRRAFVLHRIHGYSHAEVAQQTGLSRSTIEKHIMKAMKFLLKNRQRYEMEENSAQPRQDRESEEQ
ncbi:MAG: sigma-70 family RNA polymerase sigma factor [Pseudomonadota bacterium]